MKNTRKKAVIEKHKKHVKDNGSHSVQVALLTDRINELQSHLETHKKDQSSRRGLLVMVGKRRKLLNYLNMANPEEYEALLAKLNLRK